MTGIPPGENPYADLGYEPGDIVQWRDNTGRHIVWIVGQGEKEFANRHERRKWLRDEQARRKKKGRAE